MSDNVNKTSDESGPTGLERTVGTTSTSTGNVERIGVAPAMPDTGNLSSSPSQHQHQHQQQQTNEQSSTK